MKRVFCDRCKDEIKAQEKGAKKRTTFDLIITKEVEDLVDGTQESTTVLEMEVCYDCQMELVKSSKTAPEEDK